MLWCWADFARRGRGTPAVYDPPRTLVTSGPYRVVRNPMYVAGVSFLVGLALVTGAPGLIAYAAGFWVATALFVLSYEERALRRRFGRRTRSTSVPYRDGSHGSAHVGRASLGPRPDVDGVAIYDGTGPGEGGGLRTLVCSRRCGRPSATSGRRGTGLRRHLPAECDAAGGYRAVWHTRDERGMLRVRAPGWWRRVGIGMPWATGTRSSPFSAAAATISCASATSDGACSLTPDI